MQSRFAIVLTSIAGAAVLFGIGFALGLGVLSSPPPEQHKQIAVTTQPTKVTRPETTGQAESGEARRANSDRALTPLYPTSPARPAAEADNEKSQRAADPPPQSQPQQPEQQAKAPADESPKTQQAEADAAPAPKNASPMSLDRRDACDVSACTRAYRSFRESDCTYQPYSGPRQACVNPHIADRPRDARMTEGRGRAGDEDRPVRHYHRDFTADSEGDRIVVVPADENDTVDADVSNDDQ